MKNDFTKVEKYLWLTSVGMILLSFFAFDRENYLTLTASVIGVTSLILNAKGNPTGQILMILFSVFYGWISWRCAYYGEMITYLGMTAPMAVVSLVSWLRHPYHGNKSQVQIKRLRKKEVWIMVLLAVVITWGFYYILEALHTANLLFSTVSVTTSFVAAYLTFCRSSGFALAYAANDVVLIILWSMAAVSDHGYLSVIVCFTVFLINDLYGYVNWRRMERLQRSA